MFPTSSRTSEWTTQIPSNKNVRIVGNRRNLLRTSKHLILSFFEISFCSLRLLALSWQLVFLYVKGELFPQLFTKILPFCSFNCLTYSGQTCPPAMFVFLTVLLTDRLIQIQKRIINLCYIISFIIQTRKLEC